MESAIESMLQKYDLSTIGARLSALRELLQEIALLGLWRGKFFERAVFYGGTALRILYKLDRFSEDMAFSLLKPDASFSFESYAPFISRELEAWGFPSQVSIKSRQTQLESAFVKGNTVRHLLEISTPESILSGMNRSQSIRIKIEIDTDPPSGFRVVNKYLLNPIPFSIRTCDEPSLFAGKMHALLCRTWKNRVKGRDWFDYLWYVSRDTKLNLAHLRSRLIQTGHLKSKDNWDRSIFLKTLHKKIDDLDVKAALQDVSPFIANQDKLANWSKAFFHDVADRIEMEDGPG